MEGTVMLLFFSGLVLKVVDTIKEKAKLPASVVQYLWLLAIALGIGLAFAVPLNMFEMMGIPFATLWAAKLLTGVAIGIGGSILYDILDKKPAEPAPPVA